MTDAKLYSRGQMAAIVGAPEEAVVFWIEKDLLKCIDLGPRKRRLFDRREVKLAALLTEARSIGLNIGAMSSLVEQLRIALALYDTIPVTSHLGDTIAHAQSMADDGSDRVAEMQTLGFLSEIEATQMRAAAASMPIDRVSEIWRAFNFEEEEGVLVAYRDADGRWVLENNFPVPEDRLPAKSIIAFDLGKLSELEWPSK